jgi:hypothetical protein
MEKIKLFTVDLYGYLNEPKSAIVKGYQDHVKELCESRGDVEYLTIDSNPEIEEIVKNSILPNIPKKYYYQLITDLVRYDYLTKNPGSIYIDTDLCIFGQKGIDILIEYRNQAVEKDYDFTAGEMGHGRQWSCNWLMISGKTPRLSKNLFDILVKRIQNDELNKYLLKNARLSPEGKFEMTKDSLKSDLEKYIWDKLWGYACYSDIDPRSYSQIPYQLFQGYRWNSDWKSGDLLWKDVIVGCHFFGFGEGGRPTWEEFVEYHNIKID